MKTLEMTIAAIMMQLFALVLFGAWGLLLFPAIVVCAVGRAAHALYVIEHLRLCAETARAEANLAEAHAQDAEVEADRCRKLARDAGWYMPTWENLPVN